MSAISPPNSTETFAAWFDRQGFKHFKAHELEWYFSKVRYGISNKPPARALWINIIPTFRILDKLREEIGRPINISSTTGTSPTTEPSAQEMAASTFDLQQWISPSPD